MKARNIFTHILCLFLSINAIGQHTIKGSIQDDNGTPLEGATVVLLTAQDSSMQAFNITNAKGMFLLEDVDKQDYILQISYVSFKNISEIIETDWSIKTIDLGQFKMIPSSEILQEVMIKDEHIPMGIKGDTISYNTAAFKTRPGANVEDLLKKLPGIEVDRAGNIKAQGEDVEKVLVDGKSFFGDDPKMATKNLEAEAIEKVEIFDKASEIAEFTGINDGQDQKAINLKLKEDYKNGGFGKIEVGGGSESRYKSKINYNRFNPTMQASIIGASNNINEQAFGLNDYISFLGGLNNALNNSGGIFNFGDQFGEGSTPQGLNQNTSGGINFNYDFSEKLELTSNYFLNFTHSNIERFTSSQSFIDDISYSTLDTSILNDNNRTHRVNTKVKYKKSPLSQFVLRNNLRLADDDNLEEGSSRFENQFLQSASLQSSSVNRSQFAYDGGLQWRKKFAQSKRNLISNLGFKYGNLQDENFVLNNFLFGQDASEINQFQNFIGNESSLLFNTTYTEPILKKKYLSVQYAFENISESSDQSFYDLMQQGEFLNDSLSLNFSKGFTYNRAGLSFRNNGKKLQYDLGLNAQYSNLSATIISETNPRSTNYIHILPSGSLDYKVTTGQNFNIRYGTSINAPSFPTHAHS